MVGEISHDKTSIAFLRFVQKYSKAVDYVVLAEAYSLFVHLSQCTYITVL